MRLDFTGQLVLAAAVQAALGVGVLAGAVTGAMWPAISFLTAAAGFGVLAAVTARSR